MTDKDLITDIAFEILMFEHTPTRKIYDSGFDGILKECRSCYFHRPRWKYETCVFSFCPYSTSPVATRKIKRE